MHSVAFGMGVDKPDVRNVVCYGLTKSLEDLIQQWGRAGRDGLASRCTLFWGSKDIQTLTFMAQQTGNHDGMTPTKTSEQVAHNMDRVQQMQRFARMACCRRQALLVHFGETTPAVQLQEEAGFGDDCCDYCAMKLNLDPAQALQRGCVSRGSLSAEEYAKAAKSVLAAQNFLRSGAKKTMLFVFGKEHKELSTRRDFGRMKLHPQWGAAKQTKQPEAWWKVRR